MKPSARPKSGKAGTGQPPGAEAGLIPTGAQLAWLRRGLIQPGGKVPLFDETGRRVRPAVIRTCRTAGWIEPWFANPIKPGWEICRLTEAGRTMLAQVAVMTADGDANPTPSPSTFSPSVEADG